MRYVVYSISTLLRYIEAGHTVLMPKEFSVISLQTHCIGIDKSNASLWRKKSKKSFPIQRVVKLIDLADGMKGKNPAET